MPLRHAHPLNLYVPLDFFNQTHGSGSRLIVDPARTLRCCLLSIHLRAFALIHPGTDFVRSSYYISPASRELACLHRCNVPLLYFGFERPGLIRRASSGQRTIVFPLPRQKPRAALLLCLTFGLPLSMTTKVGPHARVPSNHLVVDLERGEW